MGRFTIPTLVLLLLATLAGCLPAAREDATPDAAVLAVPATQRLPGAADGLHARLETLPMSHDLVPRANLRFLEVRSGLVGSNVRDGAARIARNVGAEVAIAIGAAHLERETFGPSHAPHEQAELALRVTLIRAEDASVLARLDGPRFSGARAFDDDTLPALTEDPLVRELVRRGLERLAPRVAAQLAEEAFGAHDAGDGSLSGSSGE